MPSLGNLSATGTSLLDLHHGRKESISKILVKGHDARFCHAALIRSGVPKDNNRRTCHSHSFMGDNGRLSIQESSQWIKTRFLDRNCAALMHAGVLQQYRINGAL